MILISKEDVEEMLTDTKELDAYTFKILDEKLQKILVRAVIKDCHKCMGATFGDCTNCEAQYETTI